MGRRPDHDHHRWSGFCFERERLLEAVPRVIYTSLSYKQGRIYARSSETDSTDSGAMRGPSVRPPLLAGLSSRLKYSSKLPSNHRIPAYKQLIAFTQAEMRETGTCQLLLKQGSRRIPVRSSARRAAIGTFAVPKVNNEPNVSGA